MSNGHVRFLGAGEAQGEAAEVRAGEVVVVFDPARAWGELVVAAPIVRRVVAEFAPYGERAGGESARAAATETIGALPFGRFEDETRIEAEAFASSADGPCRVVAEVRALEEDRAGEAVAAVLDACTWAASECGCDVDLQIAVVAAGYRVPAGAPSLLAARAGLERAAVAIREVSAERECPASELRARGVDAITIGVGATGSGGPADARDPDTGEAAAARARELAAAISAGVEAGQC